MFVLDWIFLSGWQIKSYDYTIWFGSLARYYKIDEVKIRIVYFFQFLRTQEVLYRNMCLKIEIEILNILEINNLYVMKCKIISHFLSVIISGYSFI